MQTPIVSSDFVANFRSPASPTTPGHHPTVQIPSQQAFFVNFSSKRGVISVLFWLRNMTLNEQPCFSLTRKCASETHSFDKHKRRTKKLNKSPTLSVGPPKKPVEVPRTLEYKTLGKSLNNFLKNWLKKKSILNPLETHKSFKPQTETYQFNNYYILK